MRPAQPGDVCILLEPSTAELSRLRDYQHNLQAAFGGQIVDYVHITCQRFRPDSPEHLRQIASKMISVLSNVSPFPLLAGSIVTLYSEFWQTTLARWTVQESAEWRGLISRINRTLQELSCSPHYLGDRQLTCSALEHIPAPRTSNIELDGALPQVLFETRRLILSRVESGGYFTRLATTTLGSGSSEGGEP